MPIITNRTIRNMVKNDTRHVPTELTRLFTHELNSADMNSLLDKLAIEHPLDLEKRSTHIIKQLLLHYKDHQNAAFRKRVVLETQATLMKGDCITWRYFNLTASWH